MAIENLEYPVASFANRKLFRIRISAAAWSCRVLVKNGTLMTWRKFSPSGNIKAVLLPDGQWTAQWLGDPNLYNKWGAGGLSCTCPLVQHKGTFPLEKEALFAGIVAVEDEYRLRALQKTGSSLVLPGCPVKCPSNDALNANYEV